MPVTTAARVICYVDGFNLYFGLRESDFRKYLWLNIQKLAMGFLRNGQFLARTKYFTARIAGAGPTDAGQRAIDKNAKRQRQVLFLEALSTLEMFDVFEGHYIDKVVTCRACNMTWSKNEEKMTDVNIATELLTDAFLDNFDVAIIVSGDSDLVPPIRTIRKHFPAKRVVMAFPPCRSSLRLQSEASAFFRIYERSLRQSQFPNIVTRADGFELHRPIEWK